MFEQRKNTRYKTFAKVKIKGVNEGETLLKDLSVTGCCMECTAYTGIEPNRRYKIEIAPESAAKIRGFNLLVESKWTRAGKDSLEVGFSIIESPKGKSFQYYVDYLSWRYSRGNSMTGDSSPPQF